MTKQNFNAGPSILPQNVLKQASRSILELNDSDLSLLEISHRSPEFVGIMEEVRNSVLELTDLKGKGYQPLFLQGGASLQFLMVAYNLLQDKAAYLNTGRWAAKAIKEAEILGEVTQVASSADKNYSYIPKDYEIPDDIDYFHCTSNNTVAGTQMHEFPEVKAPLVCDMSSDIFSRQLDFSKFDLIYAGAQKNIGPAGTTLVIVKEDILGKVKREIPSMLDYKVHIGKDSIFNTPSVYAVYVTMLNLRWLKEQGGIEAAEDRNNEKAGMLYNEIDKNPAFKGLVAEEDRSKMNVTFDLTDDSHKEKFDKAWKEAGMVGLKGHRSVGGYRASMYNALPKSSVEALVKVMNQF